MFLKKIIILRPAWTKGIPIGLQQLSGVLESNQVISGVAALIILKAEG